jgi:hypothetical protein
MNERTKMVTELTASSGGRAKKAAMKVAEKAPPATKAVPNKAVGKVAKKAPPPKKGPAKKGPPAKKAAAKKAASKKAPAKKGTAKKAPPPKKKPMKKPAAPSPTATSSGDARTSPPQRRALPAPPTDPLIILGLSEPFSGAQLRRAWREYAATHHPDAGGDAAVFRRGRHAYQQLRRQAAG